MKKVLVILNGTDTSNYVLASAANIAKAANSILYAIFLNDDPHRF